MNEGCVGKSLTIKLYLRLPNAPVQTSKYMGKWYGVYLYNAINFVCTYTFSN